MQTLEKEQQVSQEQPEETKNEQEAAQQTVGTEENQPETVSSEESPGEEIAAPAPSSQPENPEETALPVVNPEETGLQSVDTEMPAAPVKRLIRPEIIMAIIAAFAAVLVGVLLMLCYPYINPSEDPEALPQRHEAHRATQPPKETIMEPTIPETEPENPTIPPDRNPYDRYDFQYTRHNYLLLQNVDSYPGVDVSAYQGNIDWEKVARSGIDFAIIRLGYRGYGSGKLVEDEYARQNLQGARDAGLKVGAYFFSQALNTKEVDEEITFMLDVLGETYLDMPLVLDWEIPAADARTANMDARTLTDLQLHFCRKVSEIGYQPMIYFNWHQSEHLYYLSELEDYPFWLALYQDRMTYPWKIEMWQYTCTGRVPGIYGDVDINVYMPF